jgi:uncharacterized membrane protein YoaK (UPF0700 family)
MIVNWQQTLIIAIVSFVAGNITGYVLHRVLDKDKKQSNSTFLLTMVVLVWAVSVLAGIINTSYETNPIMHGIVGTLVGFYFYKRKEGGLNDSTNK